MTYCLLQILLMCLGLDAPGSISVFSPKIVDLAHKISSGNYRTREKSYRELVEVGPKAIPLLRASENTLDFEHREICKKLIPQITQKYREKKLNELLAAEGNVIPKGLPGFANFIAITGDSKDARYLYADMMMRFWDIVEWIDFSPSETLKRMHQLLSQLYDRRDNPINDESNTPFRDQKKYLLRERPEVTLLLFAKIKGCKIDIWRDFEGKIRQAENVIDPGLIDSAECSPSINRLFIKWVKMEEDPILLGVSAEIIFDGKYQELIPTLLKWVKAENTNSVVISILLTCLGKIGDKRLINEILPLLKNRTILSEIHVATTGKSELASQSLVCDVALNVCWYWLDQHQGELGFSNLSTLDCDHLDLTRSPGFRLEETRAEAIKKINDLLARTKNDLKRSK